MDNGVAEATRIDSGSYHPHSNAPQPYYVQSPSPHSIPDQPSRFSLSILSRYSASQSSIASEKHTAHFKIRSSAAVVDMGEEEEENLENEMDRMITVRDVLVKHEEECYYERRRGCFRYLRIGRNSSSGWVCLQIGLRLMLSLGFAFLVLYIATKPPRPTVSFQIGGIRVFELGEGVDRTCIPTKILSFNSSINLLIDNKSKGSNDEMNLAPYQTGMFKLSVGTRHRPMYGAYARHARIRERGASSVQNDDEIQLPCFGEHDKPRIPSHG